MNVNLEEAITTEAPAQADPPQAGRPGKFRRTLFFVLKSFIGVVLTQAPLLSVAVIGWTYRAMQRSALKQWFKLGVRSEELAATDPHTNIESNPEASPKTKAASNPKSDFVRFVLADPATAAHASWPAWLIDDRAAPGLHRVGRFRRTLKRAFGSFGLNLRIGAQGLANTWVVTLPICMIWLFSWNAGWAHSFHKDYEQSSLGRLTGLLGVALFIAVMLYLPMAQARHAVTGEWRAFYEFRIVRALVRRAGLRALLLSAFYAGASLPLMIGWLLPGFFEQINPSLAELTDAELIEIAKKYYFWFGAVGFAAFVGLRLAAARLYARTMAACVREAVVTRDQLRPFERDVFDRLGIVASAPLAAPRSWAIAVPMRLGGVVARVALTVATALVWFAFVAQIYVGEFMNYRPFVGFMNQPLVQLPLFNYLPPGLGG